MSFRSLLVIDNDNDTITLIKFILESKTDWQVFTASGGKEGISEAQIKQPDLILLDIAMPGIDGLDVYKSLKSQRNSSSIPIIFISAMFGVEKIVESQLGENVEVITKPFNILELLNRVNKTYKNYMSLTT